MKNYLAQLITKTIKDLQTENKLPKIEIKPILIERTRDPKFGDFSSNIAMALAKEAGLKPRALAELITNNLSSPENIDTIEIAGPGFINFYLTDSALNSVLKNILHTKEKFGHTAIGRGKKINVEFVSANPTGPLHVGHGRGAAFGATLANLLKTMGYQVDREYYVNDAGRQMHILAASIWLRYLSLFEDLPHFPTGGYKGDYILAIAKIIQAKYGEKFRHSLATLFTDLPKDADEENGNGDIYIDTLIAKAQKTLGERDYSLIFDAGLQNILTDIKQDLEEFGVTFDQWFLESSLVTSGDIKNSIEQLRAKGHLYEQDGATWFKAKAFGDEKDRVVVRENGQTTYFASDIAYHLNKYNRGYEQMIDVLGADHHGYAPRIKAFLTADGFDANKLKVLLVQFAVLYRHKEKQQMSTRSGEFVTLRELRNEVGNDATRFFYIMRKNDQHLDFDIELAKSQSAENPIYYIQYAHARVCSVMRQLAEQNFNWLENEGLANLALLTNSHEEQLIRALNCYAETLQTAALQYEPHTLVHYLQDLANHFHAYYNAHQFIVADNNLRNARLCLINAVKQIIANGLSLLGVSAPEAM
jgi:arginyl-tRNA synthetase